MISLCLVIFVLRISATSDNLNNGNSASTHELSEHRPGTIIVNVNGNYNNIYIWAIGNSSTNHNGTNNKGDQTTKEPESKGTQTTTEKPGDQTTKEPENKSTQTTTEKPGDQTTKESESKGTQTTTEKPGDQTTKESESKGIQTTTEKPGDQTTKKIDLGTTNTPENSTQPLNPVQVYSSCQHALHIENEAGVYRIQIPHSKLEPFDVYCMIDISPKTPWTIIQRRKDGSVDFNHNWEIYESGFGDPKGEFFVGLKAIHELTRQTNYELWIKMDDWEQGSRYARYNSFSIDDANQYYMLRLGTYAGNAGNSLKFHNLQKFSTFDNDNDESPDGNCAAEYKAGWWFKFCIQSNLNGRYDERDNKFGVIWHTWHGMNYSLRYVRMAIRPKPD